MGIDFNTFFNQDEHTLTLKKRYNAQGKELATGVSYIFMDTIQEYIDAGYLKDNNIDGQESVFSNTDKRNLYNKFVEIYERNNKSSDKDYQKKFEGDTYTYTKDEIFELAEAAGYVVTNPVTAQEEKSEEKQEEIFAPVEQEQAVLPEAKEETPVVEVTPVAEAPREGSINLFTTTADTDPAINRLDDGEYVIDIEGMVIEDGETGEIIDEKHQTKITPVNNLEITPEEAPVQTAAATEVKADVPAPDAFEPEVKADILIADTDTEEDDTAVVEEKTDEALTQELTQEEKLAQINAQRRNLTAKIEELEKTSKETTTTKRVLGLFKKTKTTSTEYTQAESEARAAEKAELEEQLKELNKQKVWVKKYEGKYWNGRTGNNYTVQDDGTYSAQSNSYRQVTTKDGKRVAQVITGVSGARYEYAYYDVMAAEVGDVTLGHSHDYYDVVPDFSKKLDITDDQVK